MGCRYSSFRRLSEIGHFSWQATLNALPLHGIFVFFARGANVPTP